LIKWLIAKGQPIKEEDLDVVEEVVEEVVVEERDHLKEAEEAEVEAVVEDPNEAEKKTKLVDGYL
jgi:predicted anti-sigma-YlaC factor YlaD